MAKFWSFLISGVRRLNRKTKPWDGPENRLLEPVVIIPFKGTGSLLFAAKMLGRPYPTGRVRYDGTKEVRQSAYKVLMQFSGVEILDGSTDFSQTELKDTWQKDYKELNYKNQKYYVRKININKNPMLVRCSCLDFFHTWRWDNNKYNALYGALGKGYIRKTPPPPTGLPYRNPIHVCGMCRHVYQLMMLIKANGWLQL